MFSASNGESESTSNQVRSPMLVCVGMYLPLETTFAIFIGGLFKGLVERLSAKRIHNAAQKARVENNGVLLAAGLIAGEALLALLFAGLAFGEVRLLHVFEEPSYLLSLVCISLIALLLVRVPLRGNAVSNR